MEIWELHDITLVHTRHSGKLGGGNSISRISARRVQFDISRDMICRVHDAAQYRYYPPLRLGVLRV